MPRALADFGSFHPKESISERLSDRNIPTIWRGVEKITRLFISQHKLEFIDSP